MNKSSFDSLQNMRMASNFRSIINDLKRRPEDAAGDLGVSLDEVASYLSGRSEITMAIVEKAVAVWPVSPRDFFLLRDDCPDGVKIMRGEDSAQSSRTMSRSGNDYYEYRDTAMSSGAAFRPEWIRELCVVDDNDPSNPSVQWNNGHFLHQFTYFLGPVNFYYRDAHGEKQVAVMDTGDSMYIGPFVPHTFTTRANEAGDFGLILALTYSNKLGGEAQQELGLLGADQARELLIDFSSSGKATGGLIRFHRDALSMPVDELARRVSLTAEEVEEIEAGQLGLTGEVLESFSRELNVDIRELTAAGAGEDSVQISRRDMARRWSVVDTIEENPAYEVAELCGSERLPFSKALEITVGAASLAGDFWLRAGLHQYVYNLGVHPATLKWEANAKVFEEIISPGDSLYMKPGIRHAFASLGTTLLVLRIGGRIGGDALHELATVGAEQLDRVLSESMQWFDPKGRKDISR